MQLHYVLHDAQSQTSPAFLTGTSFVDAIESLEKMGEVFVGNATTIIFYFAMYFRGVGIDGSAYGNN